MTYGYTDRHKNVRMLDGRWSQKLTLSICSAELKLIRQKSSVQILATHNFSNKISTIQYLIQVTDYHVMVNKRTKKKITAFQVFHSEHI